LGQNRWGSESLYFSKKKIPNNTGKRHFSKVEELQGSLGKVKKKKSGEVRNLRSSKKGGKGNWKEAKGGEQPTSFYPWAKDTGGEW